MQEEIDRLVSNLSSNDGFFVIHKDKKALIHVLQDSKCIMIYFKGYHLTYNGTAKKYFIYKRSTAVWPHTGWQLIYDCLTYYLNEIHEQIIVLGNHSFEEMWDITDNIFT